MRTRRRRYAARMLLAAVVILLAYGAAGCGGDDDDGDEAASATELEGLGSSFEEIQELAREEGQVNLVVWAGYADKSWADTFTQETGCKVNTKDGASSDDMVQLISTGEYDGVSASGDATLRLIAKEDVAPVNLDLIPNYENVYEGLKGQPHNTVDGVSYGVPHGRGPNLMVFRSDELPAGTDSWSVIWDEAGPYKGRISVYNNAIFIADAAVYLKATRPELDITNPYELDDEQFQAAVELLEQQTANDPDYWDGGTITKQIQSFTTKDSVVGTTWPYQVNLLNAAKPPVPVEAIKPKEGTTGWSDTWMVYSQAQNPNCAYLWMNYIISPEANAKVAEFFGEAPVSAEACEQTKDPAHCDRYHADDESWWEDVYYWNTPVKDCGDDRGEVCKEYSEWVAAWTEIRG